MTRSWAPSPEISPENIPFFDAANEGRLLLRHCLSCNRSHYYPRTICPLCFSSQTEWRDVAGNGEVYTFSVMCLGPQRYALGLIQLPEGPRMLAEITDCDLDALAIGDPVRVLFKPTQDGQAVPCFTVIGAIPAI